MDTSREPKVVRVDAEPDATVRIHWRLGGRTFGESFVRREDVPNAADRALLQRAAEVLGDLLDSEECRLDHHGYCQTHGWMDESTCSQKRGRSTLAAIEARLKETA